jgi:hypothetical protein
MFKKTLKELQAIVQALFSGNTSWRVFGPYRYDGWLYHEAGAIDGDQSAYIFQDMATAILGHFENNTLINGRAAQIKKFRSVGSYRHIFKDILHSITSPFPESIENF